MTWSWTDVLARLQALLNTKLLVVGGTSITLATAVTAFAVIVFTVWFSKLVRRGVRSLFRRRGIESESTIGTVAGLLHYLILVSGFGVALQTMGIDLAALFAAGAIFAIGLGFAMQNIAQNFVSGVILLVERAIKPGDVLEVDGLVVKVSRLGIRATIVQTRDGEDLIVPNSVLAQGTVKNYTLEESTYRLRTLVGVSYASDVRVVRSALESCAHALEWRVREREPQVLLLEFGDNALIFEVAVWMNDPWRARPGLSRLNEAIWWAFKQHDITMAFPQIDVHFDAPIVDGLRKLTVA